MLMAPILHCFAFVPILSTDSYGSMETDLIQSYCLLYDSNVRIKDLYL